MQSTYLFMHSNIKRVRRKSRGPAKGDGRVDIRERECYKEMERWRRQRERDRESKGRVSVNARAESER